MKKKIENFYPKNVILLSKNGIYVCNLSYDEFVKLRRKTTFGCKVISRENDCLILKVHFLNATELKKIINEVKDNETMGK